MSAEIASASAPQGRLNIDFWKYWTGETISNLGSSFTNFAGPLLIYVLTGSALNLGLSTAAGLLPYLLFGLVIGAWVDRLNRKRLMIVVDLLLALTVASVPLMYFLGLLTVWWMYGVIFVASTLGIFFSSAEFAAIPSLVSSDDLVTANGRIQASFAGAQVLGPLLAGALLFILPLPALMFVDASSFLVSAFMLSIIRKNFNTSEQPGEKKSVRQDVVEGLRYVLGHPVLRNISAMMAMVNFVAATINAQLVLFASVQLRASKAEIGILYSAGSLGIVVLSLLAGPLRKRWSFSTVALGALMLEGLLTIVFAFTPWYWVAVVIWSVVSGLGVLFNINTSSLRQAIVPNHLLGRVMSIAGVLAWSAIPVGAFLGGLIIQQTGNVILIYAVIGLLTFLIPLGFAFTPLGHAERYLPKEESGDTAQEGEAAKVASA